MPDRALPTFQLAPTSKLKPFPGNPKIHNEDVDVLLKLMGEYGWTNPILVQKGTWRIIAGHGRHKAALKGGIEKVPVCFLDMDDDEALGYTIADNESAKLSRWDYAKLQEHMSTLKDLGFALDKTGFPSYESDMLTAADFSPPKADTKDPKQELVSYTTTAEQGQTIRKALDMIRRQEKQKDMSEGRALELMCADFLA